MVETATIQDQVFPKLQDAFDRANCLVNSGEITVEASRVYCDRFSPPRGKSGRHLKLLGVSPKAARVCEKLAPGGQWYLQVEPPGTIYYRTGPIFGEEREFKTHHYRFAAWYTRFLPYAIAMMEAEDAFECAGVDFSSINSYFGTCKGFIYLGRGEVHDGLDPQDVELFSRIDASDAVGRRGSTLPFEWAFDRCVVFAALRDPGYVDKHLSQGHHARQLIVDVAKELGAFVPANIAQSVR